MKRLCLFPLLLATSLAAVPSAGRAAPATTNAPAPEKITISSGTGQFDGRTGWVTYTDHVRVDHPAMKLTCEWLNGNAPHGHNPDRRFIARTNVVIDVVNDSTPWHITCNQAVYDFHLQGTVTNETVTLTGNAIAKSPENIITGEPLVYDMVTKSYHSSNFQMTHLDTNSAAGGTNRAPGNPFHL